MASTRNRNTRGDYLQEQTAYANQFHYTSYDHSPFFGVAQTTQFAGNGLVGMKSAHRVLSQNYCDIETQLFGIGSTNLVNPKDPITPEIYSLPTWDLSHRIPLFVPAEEPEQPPQRRMPLS